MTRSHTRIPFFLLLPLCGALAQAEAPGTDARQVPAGTKIEASGFATVLAAPPVPYPEQPPPSDREQGDVAAELEWAMTANPSEGDLQAAMALARRLEAAEGENFIGTRVIRDPMPRFAFQFQKEAADALARYTDDPRFVAVEGGLPAAQLRIVADEWSERFAPHRLGVGNVYEFEGIVRFGMQVDEATFRTIAASENWHLPSQVELDFTTPPNPRAIDPALESYIRIVPRHDRVPGIVPLALMSGRVILREGCFRLAGQDQEQEPLVIFDRDSALVLDAQGYMAIEGGSTGQPLPRIGERFAWAGPRGVDERDAGVQALRAVCGEGEIVSVGTPSSAYHARVRPWVIDQLARDRGITRQQAWMALRRCWALEDETDSEAPLSPAPRKNCGVPPSYL